jgi:ubiquinone/menaquinone biosynthesis C-methylase UbiE
MREFWEEQAKKFGEDVNAVNFDPIEEELEMSFLKEYFSDGDVVCDVGCGNGRTLLALAAAHSGATFHGVDFAAAMIERANEAKARAGLENVHFRHFDASSSNLSELFTFKFDKILTKRLLINVKGEARQRAVDNIHAMLKDDGTYVMVECFIEPLQRINEIRAELELKEIKVREFNEYLTEDFLGSIKDRFVVENKRDFESLYYFISRVFNAHLSEGEPDYHAPINKLAARLIEAGVNPIEGYSPEVMLIMKKSKPR